MQSEMRCAYEVSKELNCEVFIGGLCSLHFPRHLLLMLHVYSEATILLVRCSISHFVMRLVMRLQAAQIF